MIKDGFKSCKNCGLTFYRPKKISDKQWDSREFCSRSCGATRNKIDIPEIKKLYHEDMLSSTEIAKVVGISSAHVLRIMRKNNIDRRNESESKKLALSRPEVRERMRLSKVGIPLSEKAKEKLRQIKGESNANWNFGMTINKQGYMAFTNSESNGVNAGKLLHRIIAQWLYGREIEEDENVHHIDGNKLNNNPENLCIIKAKEHAKIHRLGDKK